MKCIVAPFFRSDISDGFGEVPAVTIKVLSVILTLAVGVIFRFSQDNGAVLPRAFAMTIHIFDTNLNDMRMIG